MTSYFPSFVGEVGNEALMDPITKEELQKILHYFQKDKNPQPLNKKI